MVHASAAFECKCFSCHDELCLCYYKKVGNVCGAIRCGANGRVRRCSIRGMSSMWE